MDNSNLPRNLKLLCGYGRSISDVCRKAGINRQQFQKYLSGQAVPSLQSLRLICDYFGVDEAEILMDYADFSELIRRRPPRLRAKDDPLYGFVTDLAANNARSTEALRKYQGYYFTYMRPFERDTHIMRALTYIYESDGLLLTKSIDRNRPLKGPLPGTIKYKGFVVHLAERLMLIERELSVGECVMITLLFATDFEPVTYLTGLLTGIMPESSKQVQSYRVVYEYLGQSVDLRATLSACSTFELGALEIDDYIERCTSNDIAPEETTFVARY